MIPRLERSWAVMPLLAAALLVAFTPDAEAKKAPKTESSKKGKCPSDMVSMGKYCIDPFEAAVVEITGKGKTKPHPHYLPVTDLRVKAVSKKGVYPQAYISRNEAEGACKEAKKRLCSDDEWLLACKGKGATTFPYGDERREGYCNDAGVSPLNHFFGEKAGDDRYTWASMNDPRLNQLEGGLARTGAKARCKGGNKVYDLVGNLHEWTADVNGTFRGGYYLDTKINGEGCNYKTTAHHALYHDYSTGFRCCKDAKLVIKAQIRVTPGDFVVDEIPAYEPSGAGEHLYLTVRKTGLDTLEAARRLASRLRVQPRDVGSAGLKDRHGITTQQLSFHYPTARGLPTAAELSGEGLEVLAVARHGNKLRTGHLRGNRFRLVLRGLQPGEAAELSGTLLRLGTEGIPNRFGVQRFGRHGDNVAVALSWMEGKSQAPRDLRIKRLQFSAVQSALFHEVLDRRLSEGTWSRALAGDLLVKEGGGRPFVCEDPAAVEAQVAAGDLGPTGPMYGAEMPWPTGAVAELERAILGAERMQLLDRWHSLGEGARRLLVLKPRDLRVEEAGEGALGVSFSLPKGAYATTVLDAACEVVDVMRPRGADSVAESPAVADASHVIDEQN
jgi:tRNA pseudouridine13 synthase